MMTNAWMAMSMAMQAANRRPKASSVRSATRRPANSRSTYSSTTPRAPARPSSSRDGGEDVVGLCGGDIVGLAQAEALAGDSPGLNGVGALERLEAGAVGLGVRIEPDVDACLDVSERQVPKHAGYAQEHQSGEHEPPPPRRDVEGAHHEEHEQRDAAQVFEERERRHRGENRSEQRNNVREGAVGPPAEAQTGCGEHPALVGEVGGEEDHEEDLDQLRRLHGLAGNGEPEPGAVDGGAEQTGGEEQQHGGERRGVLVAAEHGVASPCDDPRDHHDNSRGDPIRLALGSVRRQPHDEREPNGGEQHGDGVRLGFGLRRKNAKRDMSHSRRKQELR